MIYETYTATLSKIMHGTATDYERQQVAKYEAARPNSFCPKCHRRLHTIIGSPARITHDNTNCDVKKK